MIDSARSVFKLIYKVGMILITVMLAGGAILAYVNSTTANGLLLISGILGMLTLIAGLSITKLDDQDRQAETYRQIGVDFRKLVKVSTSYAHAKPEVHRVDLATVEKAKQMAADGAPIDDICRAIDPGHDGHDPAHQEAFRQIVQAMVDQA
ncbi:MAG TPA: hypothetical protein VNA29_00215 [Sphingomicrobium sp.]|nr:hypothetical protein [Sphingomicrobium sp.]